MWVWVVMCALLTCTAVTPWPKPRVSLSADMYMQLFNYAMKDSFPQKKIDMNKIMHEFTSICPYLSECDTGHVTEPAPPTYKRSDVSISACKPCDCTFKCMSYANCCPGSPYQYFKYQSENVILNSKIPKEPRFMDFISHCPTSYDDDEFIIHRCHGNNSILHPASSRNTFLSYRNRFCASCHKESNLYIWPMDIYCTDTATVTARSNVKDILSDNSCWQEFWSRPSLVTVQFPMLSGANHGIGTCNRTGLWEAYDEDIHWACETMNYEYRGFRNPFCYICNPGMPPLQSQSLIDSCNVTGSWKTDTPEVKQKCLSQPQHPRLFPFKNIHCMICNNFEVSMSGNYFTTSVTESLQAWNINISIEINRKQAQFAVMEIVESFNMSGLYPFTSVKHQQKNQIENMPYIEYSYNTVCGNVGYRVSNWGLRPACDEQPSCSYSSNCLEHTGGCCHTVLLKYNPLQCVSSQSIPKYWTANSTAATHPGEKNKFPMVSECLTDDSVSEHFVFPTNVSLENWPNIPVGGSTQHRIVQTVYKNLSYWLCNSQSQIAYIDLQLYCNQYMDYIQYPDITQFLYTAKDKCNIYFLPADSAGCRQTNLTKSIPNRSEGFYPTSNISKLVQNAIESAFFSNDYSVFSTCNQTGKWQRENSDIELICESDSESFTSLSVVHGDKSVYKNFACFICNPDVNPHDVDRVISKCNETGAWTLDTNLESALHQNASVYMELCDTAEYHERWLPFKNYYCSICNLPYMKYDGDIDKDRYVFRYLMSISEVDWTNFIRSTETFLPSGNEYNNSKNLLCSDGHLLTNESCIAAYTELELSYRLSLELRWNKEKNGVNNECLVSNIQQENTVLDLKSLTHQITDNITNKLKTAGYQIKGFYGNGTANTVCRESEHNFVMTALSRISFSFLFGFIGKNSTDFETMLLTFLHSKYIVNAWHGTGNAEQCMVGLEASPRSSQTSSVVGLEACSYSTELSGIDFLLPNSVQAAIAVDQFLLCPQFEFHQEEFIFNKEANYITMKYGSIVIPLGYFKKKGTAVRVCADDYRLMRSRTPNFVPHPLVRYYHVFSYVVIGISLVCLALTLATYCTFPSLRNLPGKNVMVLTGCLFCGQCLRTFALRLEPGTPVCKAMGMLVHYFWLASFCAMNVCSFHLYKTFYKSKLQSAASDNEKKLFFKYLLYVCGLPLIFLAVTISFYVIPSGGQTLGYGEIICFLSDVTASIAAFIVPAGLVFASNVVFFGFAFHGISTTTTLESFAKTERKDVYISMGICVIIGITWPLYFVDSVIGFSIFSFVVEGINSLQGLFIFLSYICNQRILALFKDKFKCLEST